jgi:hypothetical protein
VYAFFCALSPVNGCINKKTQNNIRKEGVETPSGDCLLYEKELIIGSCSI